MKNHVQSFLNDFRRFGSQKPNKRQKLLLKSFRYSNSNSKIISSLYRLKFKRIKEKLNIDLFYKTNIGDGLYIGHPCGISINADTIIGKNCNIHKGVTIGQENRGTRKGTPVIGNNVWIGVNATIVGKIKIGDDVLIAPNSFVNCDIPSHSIVIGNPCLIKHKDNATEEYINNPI